MCRPRTEPLTLKTEEIDRTGHFRQFYVPFWRHQPATTPNSAPNTSCPLLPPHCPTISTSKSFKIIPKGCERSQTEEGCLLNAFSEFSQKKTKFPDGRSRGFPSPMGAQGGFRAQIGNFTRHLTRAPRGPWPILPPCTCPGDISLALGPPGYHARPRYRAEKGLK